MSRHMKSVAAAARKAASDATDAAPTITLGTVTAWADPRATVNLGGTSIPKVRATAEAAANITVGSVVVVQVHGSLALITGTL